MNRINGTVVGSSCALVASRQLAKSCAILMVVVCGSAAAQPALEYLNQADAKTKDRSSIMTSDKKNVWDFQFDAMVLDAIGDKDTFKGSVAFNFNQCFGGGMIDELLARNWKTAAFTSAARYNQCSLARCEDLLTGIDPNNPGIRRSESTYSFRFLTKAASGGPMPFKDAATKGRAEDISGPFGPNKTFKGAVSAQYTSSGATGDAMQLHRGPNGTNPPGSNYKAILWGGSSQLDRGNMLNAAGKTYVGPTDVAANWNSLERAHDQLLKAGYKEEDIYVCYTGGEDRDNQDKPTGKIFKNGPKLPDWVDAGTRYVDMRSAWGDWLKPKVDDKTQVFFWSSFGHGNTMVDAKAQKNAETNKDIEKGQTFNFEMDPDVGQTISTIYNYYQTTPAEDGANALPYFDVETSVYVPLLTVELNGSALTLLNYLALDDGGFMYKFAMDATSIAELQSLGQTLKIDYNFFGADNGQYNEFASFINIAGPTAGDFANGPEPDATPTPGAGVLLAMVGIGAGRRRR